MRPQNRESGGLKFGFREVLNMAEDPSAYFPSRWQVTTVMYEYRLLDRYERELLVYHWQPGPDFLGPSHPHLHVSASLAAQVDAATRREIALDKVHLPTGQVSIAAYVRSLITEFGIAPLRDDWREVLDRAEGEFGGEQHRPKCLPAGVHWIPIVM